MISCDQWPAGAALHRLQQKEMDDGGSSLERSALTNDGALSLDRLGWAQPVNTPLRSGMRLVLVGYSISLSHLAKAGKNKSKKTLASFFCRKNKNTRRQVLQNKGPNRAYSR
jgi:hypothetical protein